MKKTVERYDGEGGRIKSEQEDKSIDEMKLQLEYSDKSDSRWAKVVVLALTYLFVWVITLAARAYFKV